MILPDSLTKKSYTLVATTNGFNYSLVSRGQEKWVHNRYFTPVQYVPPAGYKPLHKKNLRRGLKLFLEEKFPGFKKDESRFKR